MSTDKVLDIVLGSHSAILGKTGSGKTSTGKLAVERLVAQGGRVCILDPIKSDWWGLASSADGKKPGLPFNILGGPRGHVPLHHASGKAIGEIVANGALPLSIIDMADFPPGGQAKFFIDFAPTLLRKMRGVVHLVLEEAHLFAPKERSGVGDENMAIHWAKMLATAGRSKGIRLILVTQRTQALHNALLGSCETMVAHRLTAPADQKPLVDWLKANTTKDVTETVSSNLASLKTGTAWVCSGEAKYFEMVHFGRIKTYDNSATPVQGSEGSDGVKTAAVDLDKLHAIMGAAAREADANDPAALRRQLADANKKLAKLELTPAVNIKPGTISLHQTTALPSKEILAKHRADGHAAGIKIAYPRGFKDGFEACKVQIWDAVCALQNRVGDEYRKYPFKMPPPKVPDDLNGGAPPKADLDSAIRQVSAPRQNQRRDTFAEIANGKDGLEKPLQKIVDAIRWWNVLGVAHPAQVQVAFVAGYSHNSGTWSTYLGRLRSLGLIEGRGELDLTDAGLAEARDPDVAPDGDGVRDAVMKRLDGPQQRIMKPLIEAYPNSLSQARTAEEAGYSSNSGTWSTYLGRLRSLDIITGRGELKVQDWLFP